MQRLLKQCLQLRSQTGPLLVPCEVMNFQMMRDAVVERYHL